MRHVSRLSILIIGFGVSAAVCTAQQPKGKRADAPKDASNRGPANASSADALVARMMAFDKNKDGKLTKDEITDERLLRLFERADSNKEGIVTKEELMALATQLNAESGQGGDRGFPRRGPSGGRPGGPRGGGPGGPDDRGPGGRAERPDEDNPFAEPGRPEGKDRPEGKGRLEGKDRPRKDEPRGERPRRPDGGRDGELGRPGGDRGGSPRGRNDLDRGPGDNRGPGYLDGPGMPRDQDPEMAQIMETDRALERETFELSDRYRRAPEAQRAAIRQKLVETVNKHFEARQQRRELELKRIEGQLERLRESIKTRAKNRERLVGSRVSELTGDGETGF